MMTGWPRCFAVASASARIEPSVAPPAGHGQMRVTGLVGNCCADAVAASESATAPMIRRRNMMLLLCARRASLRLRRDPFHHRLLGGEGLAGVARVVLGRHVPEVLVVPLER